MRTVQQVAVVLTSVVLIAQAMPWSAFAAPVTLITNDEAALPPPKGAVAMSARGVTRGPKVEFVAPVSQKSPVKISLKFVAFGGSSIDLESVRVTYMRATNVELTSRVKPFISATGIEMPEAQVPPGNHTVRVEMKDSDGRAASTSFTLKVDH